MTPGQWLRQIQRFDWLLMLGVFILFAFGLAAIYSVELSRESSDFILVKKQLVAFLIGIVFLVAISYSNYLQLRNYARIIYVIGVLLLVAVLIFGTELRGTTGWFIVAGISFQPVEFMKIALVIELARYFGEHARRRFGWREIISSGMLVAVPFCLTALQPDLGSAMLLLGMWVVVMFFAGLRASHASVIAVTSAVIAVIGWFFVLKDYQKERIHVFLNPALDPLVSGYNIAQAKIAIGSGQLFGRGLGFGSQSQLKFLPESETDFVFAVIAEELGFFGVAVVLAAFALIFWRFLYIARNARDNFTSFLIIAIFGALFVQMAVNIGVNLAILPTTGIALPFMSYGGSSLLSSFVLIGIAQSIAVRMRPGERQRSMV
ncbi:MAG: rod shape-determining protein RodA [Patescibacteria group bacterium]|nr:rod shape-determining protein RodA [Patescibacteria group bacterium]